MTKKDISEAISNLSDRHIQEVTDFIEESEAVNMNKKKILIKYLAAAACFVICILSAAAINKSDIFNRPEPTTEATSIISTDSTHNVPSNEFMSENSSTQPMTYNGPVGGDSGSLGATNSSAKAMTIGVGFSQTEIENYINENKENILQIIEAEYSFDINSVWVNKKGYCHASCDNDNKVNLDYITLPILVNGEIYASVTLIKAGENDIVETVNIGGKTWENYNSVISANPEAEIVFAFLPNAVGEIMIMPDNTAVNPVDGEIQSPIAVLNPDINWYELLKTQYNTVKGSELLSAENNIAIKTKEVVTKGETWLDKYYDYEIIEGEFNGYIGGKVIEENKVKGKLANVTLKAGWKNAEGVWTSEEKLKAEAFAIENVESAVAVAVKFIDKGEALTTTHYYVLMNPKADLSAVEDYVIIFRF